MKSKNPIVNMALNLADRRRPGVVDVEVKIKCDSYDRAFNIKTDTIREDCHLHDTFLREWLGHIGKGPETDRIIKSLETNNSYEGEFLMSHHFSLRVTRRPKTTD